MTIYRRNTQTASRVIEAQAFVVSGDHNTMITLNEAATVLWELAASGCTAADAARALSERFEIDLEGARRDAEACLNDLVERGVLLAEAAPLNESAPDGH